jgi:CheY-like chemotaxis protein/HPt (histidine-containing phosphotransfer) domain-containing protein
MVIGYGRREATRTLTPAVASIDLLRREPFVTGMALLAGRVAAEPNAPLKAEDLKCGRIPPTLEQARAAGRLILVAEDDATNRAVLKRQLAVLGHAAEFAHDGRQALSCWRAGNHAMLLTDLHMPEMDGYALTTLIREEEGRGARARLPIVALTANALKGEVVRARAVGMDDYLAKPVPLALLRATLNAWMPATTGATALVEPIAAEPATSLATASATLNVQTLRDLIGDDAGALHGLLADFEVSARQHSSDLRAALRAGDAQAVSAVAHKLKSASRSVGAHALGDVCAVLEAAAVAGASALQPEHRERFDDAFDAAMASLHAHLDPLPI